MHQTQHQRNNTTNPPSKADPPRADQHRHHPTNRGMRTGFSHTVEFSRSVTRPLFAAFAVPEYRIPCVPWRAPSTTIVILVAPGESLRPHHAATRPPRANRFPGPQLRSALAFRGILPAHRARLRGESHCRPAARRGATSPREFGICTDRLRDPVQRDTLSTGRGHGPDDGRNAPPPGALPAVPGGSRASWLPRRGRQAYDRSNVLAWVSIPDWGKPCRVRQ
jgi:hypothetical protein